MGAGKSTALAAARELGLRTTEADELMEEALGMPIRDAFEERLRDNTVTNERVGRCERGVKSRLAR